MRVRTSTLKAIGRGSEEVLAQFAASAQRTMARQTIYLCDSLVRTRRVSFCSCEGRRISQNHFLETFLPFLALGFFLSPSAAAIRPWTFLISSIMKARVILSNKQGYKNHAGVNVDYLPFSNLSVGEETTVGAADSSVTVGHFLQGVGTSDLDSLHLGTLSVLLEVLDGKFTSGGTESAELVSLGSVRGLSLVCNSSIEHCIFSIY
jgi:hypothetical protein